MLNTDQICARLANIETILVGKYSPWLTIKEAAGYAHVSPTTFRRWISAGFIPVHRPREGGKLLFHRKQIDSFILFGTFKPTKRQREFLRGLK